MSSTALPPPQSILLKKGHNIRTLLIVLAIMAFIAGTALLFSRATLRLSGEWQAQLSQSMTVQVTLSPLSDDNNYQVQMTRASNAVKTAIGQDASVSIITQSEANALIRPWIGNLDLPDTITLPGLISIEGKEGASLPTPRALQQTLSETGLVVSIDDHSRWSDQISGTAKTLVLAGTALLTLLLIASVSVNLFATRAAMAAQRSIIAVLAQVGATDNFIIKLFIGQAGKRSAIGSAVGLGLLWILWAALSSLKFSDEIFWSSFSDILSDTLWLAALWLFFTLICALAAGLTTKYALRYERKKA